MAADLNCEPGKILCNPLIFGVMDLKTPKCIPPSQQATTLCKTMNAGMSADEFLKAAPGAVATAWDSFASRFNSVCDVEPAARSKRCNECTVMSAALKGLNALVSDVQNCGQAVKWQAKNSSDTSPAAAAPKSAPAATAPAPGVAPTLDRRPAR